MSVFCVRSNDTVDVPSDAGNDDFLILLPHPEESEANPSFHENVEQLLTQMERDWTAATDKRDAATLDRIIAERLGRFHWGW